MAKESSQSQFRIKCSICGKYGTVRIKREDKDEKMKQRERRLVLKHQEYINDQMKGYHPYYYRTVLKCFFDFNALLNENKKKPIIVINTPKKPESEPRANNKASDGVLRDLAKSISLFLKMLPLVTLKYPEDIIAVYGTRFYLYISPGFNLLITLLDAITPTIMYYQENLLSEWAREAVQKKEEKNPRAAAETKKYSGITSDRKGKGQGEAHLSIPAIREKTPQIQEFFSNYNSSEFIFIVFIGVVMKKIHQDPELIAAYRKYEKDYDDDDDDEQQRQVKISYDKKEKSYYEYFVVRHYDPKLYEEQKYYLDIRKCDGRIEHRIEEKDIPPDIVQALRSRRSG
jgi:hypothetical protein